MRENGRPKRKGGQALAEMAVMVPFLVIGMMGFLDLGRAFYYQISLTNAVREATRYGIQNAYFGLAPACVIPTNLGPSCPVPPDDAICAHVVQELAGSGFNVTCPGDVTILPDQQGRFTNYTGAPQQTQYQLTVAGTYKFHFITPIISNLIGDPLTLRSSAEMRTDY
ncbi:MAG: pilus assembly protein [Chloroflexi bacterium]|nr:MAG: pilus assembly protein [Chloroflexota bacterium]TMG37679.1 MAG: pilus assembly protein [Chloroflexota bacterium]